MHLKEIIIDGFKSYSVKTNINNFDKQFNAITGLNGSGKSNILDAICFVLGISSLSHVRASNLQELIYKYGNAGINKASVTIIFDNSEKKYTPIGCEEYDEVIVTRSIHQGKSKYYLNGYNATQENIKTLFQSVQLNINNPHFLIMQGKVTQVVNMKPLEILGLLEEAAGTSIYEMKKDAAQKTIKKKDNKVEEINKILIDEISPQLEKLLKDKQNYLTWKSRENEIGRITKIIAAMDFQNTTEQIYNKTNNLEFIKLTNENINSEIQKKAENLENLKLQMQTIENICNKENNKYLHDLDNKNKDMVTTIRALKQKDDNLNINSKNILKEINKLENDNIKFTISIENLEKNKKDKENSINSLEKELELKGNLLKEFERNIESLKTGKINQDGEVFNMNKIISEMKNNINKCIAEKNTLCNQIKIFEDQRNSKKNQMNDYKKSIDSMKKQANLIEKKIKEIKQELNLDKLPEENINVNNNLNNQQIIELLKRDINNNESELQRFESKQSELLGRWASRVETNYRDPEPNFERLKIKGKIIRLFSIENERYATALEQVAGGKLFNIVVDNERTASLLLSRKCFDYWVVMIPNNKIANKTISNDVRRAIEDIAGNDARLALDLIKFDQEYTPAMQFVFGTTYICTNSEIAKKLAYNDRIKVRCVNLEGDIFDPTGTMTGGANFRNSENIILKVQELNFVQGKIKEIKESLMKNKNELNYNIENIGKSNQLKITLENLVSEKAMLSEENITKTIKNYENDLSRSEDEILRTEERIEQLMEMEKKYGNDLKKLSGELEEMKRSGSSKEIYVKKIKETKVNLGDLENSIKTMKKNLNEIDFSIKNKKDEILQNFER